MISWFIIVLAQRKTIFPKITEKNITKKLEVDVDVDVDVEE